MQIPRIIQAPMAGAHDSALVIAVCQAGGLGSLPTALLSKTKILEEAQRIKDAVGERPFNMNFFAHEVPSISVEQREAWEHLLTPYLAEYDLTVADIPTNLAYRRFSDEDMDIIETVRPAVVSFHFGLPSSNHVQAIKATGAQVWSSATTVDEAIYLEKRGADMIIAQGYEAGGHRGMFLNHDLTQQLGTFALLPQVIDAVSVPVIAAGGISDARMAKVAFDLGATAIQAGTAFLLAHESTIKPIHRKLLQSEAAKHTVITNLLSGGYARGLINRFMQENSYINEAALPFPMSSRAVGLLKSYAEKVDKTDFSSLWSGQNALLAKPGSAAEIVKRLSGE